MDRTRRALEGLLHYDEAATIRPLETVPIEKEDIPRYVVCPGYERAHSRVERSMERYTARVAQTDDRLRQSKQNIAELEDAVGQWAGRAKGVSTFKELTLDRSSASSVDSYNRDVARHNDALDQARRYQDRLENAIDKHNDLIERHNEAVRQAEEKLEELSLEELGQIDEDLVSFFERCRSAIEKLRDTEDAQDILACGQAAYIAIKLHNAFEVHIDGAATRREAREHVAAIADALFELCSMKEFRESIEGLFRSNVRLMEENAERHTQVLNLISGAHPEELTSARQTLSALLGAKFPTSFSYVGIVDPLELEAIINSMQSTVEDIKTSSADIKKLHQSSASLAEAAVAAQAEAESTLTDMNAAVIQSRDTLLFPGHFTCDIVDPDVIDILFKRDLQNAAYAVREQLSDSLGGEAFASLIAGVEDRFWTSRTEDAIALAELSALQVERDKVESRVRRNSALIPGIAEQIHFAEAVPSQNAEKFRSLASILYPLSCFPIFGFIAAWFMMNKIEAFASAFSSSNRVYTELKVGTGVTNARYKKINTYVFINIISALMLARIEKRLVECSTGDALALESDRTALGD